MLEMNPDKVCYVIAKTRAFEEEDLIEDADETEPEEVDLDHEEAFDQLESHEEEPDPIREAVIGFVDDLNEEEQLELVALAWLGRGDFDAEEWGEALQAARERHNNRTGEYLIGMPRLADYLEEGLAYFDLSCTDFDESRM